MLPNILNIDNFRGNYCKDFKVRIFSIQLSKICLTMPFIGRILQ